MSEVRVEYKNAPQGHQLSLLKHMWVERGTIEDWHLMKDLHYKMDTAGVAPKFLRVVLDGENFSREPIGVISFTMPRQLDAGRNEVFTHLKPNQSGRDTTLMNSIRTNWVNKNIALGARIVIDTNYRSGGVAYRFINLAFRMNGFRFSEQRSSMGRFNPFITKAGVRFVAPKAASAQDQGYAFLKRNFVTEEYDYASLLEEYQSMPPHIQEHVLTDMRSFYYKNSAQEKSGDKRDLGMTRVNTLDVEYLIRQVLQLTLGATLYGIYQNPDFGIKLPARVPLLAFDNQKTNELLRLDLL